MATTTARKKQTAASEQLIEYVSNRGVTLGVDRDKSVIRGIKILGLESKNGRSYSPAGIKAAMSLYEGVRVNVNHPAKGETNKPRSYADRMGSIKNVSFVEGQGLFGDYHLNPKHKLADQLLWDAENAPENVGFSHNAEGRCAKRDGKTVVESIISVTSVDLVADPATTRGLYESETTEIEEEQMDLSTLTVDQVPANLREAIGQEFIKQLSESEAVKTRDAEFKALKEELDKLKSTQALAERRATIDGKIAEAKLPDSLLSDTFRALCYESTDEQVAAFIEERQGIAKGISFKKPKSMDQGGSFGSFEEAYTPDAKKYASALRG